MYRNQLSREEMRLVNAYAKEIANRAWDIYRTSLVEAALLAFPVNEKMTEDWLRQQMPAIDGEMRELFPLHSETQSACLGDDAEDDWHDVEPF